MYTQASPSILLQSAIGLGCLTTCPENGLMEGETDRGRSKGKRIDGDRPMEGMNEWEGPRGGSRERKERK